MPDVTRLLDAAASGDARAAGELLPLVYDELRKLAAVQMAREKPGQTLSPTALVHEAYLRLVRPSLDRPGAGGDSPPDGRGSDRFAGAGHFFAAAAESMRRILVEQARRKGRLKRGGGKRRFDLVDVELAADGPPDDLLALDEALSRLDQLHPERAALVKLRYFAGLTISEAATALGISTSTADRYWTYARAWLYREIALPGEP